VLLSTAHGGYGDLVYFLVQAERLAYAVHAMPVESCNAVGCKLHVACCMQLAHCTFFKSWNSIRAKGTGEPCPCAHLRLCVLCLRSCLLGPCSVRIVRDFNLPAEPN
jgi:hypothetical protein